MKNILVITLLLFALLLAGCEDPAANKVKAVTSESAPTADGPAFQPQGEALAIDAENSKVLFTGSKVTGKHEGGFSRFGGTIYLVDGNVEKSGVDVQIETASVFTDADVLTEHLQTGDFFEVEKYPAASFRSTRVTADKEAGPDSYKVSGNLELRGVKKFVVFPATITVTSADVAVNADFAINRKDFGIIYAGKADDLIRDDVAIKLDLKATRKM